jgi:hypothetical protein
MESNEQNINKIRQCLTNLIPKEESILELSTVLLSINSPKTNNIFLPFNKEGILCVIVNRKKSCLFLQLFDLIEFKKVFEIELYANIIEGYNAKNLFFHTIEFPGFFLGISYNNENSRAGLIQKSIFSISKFFDVNEDFYSFSFEFDFDVEKKEIESQILKLKENLEKENNKIDVNIINKNIIKKEKELKQKIQKISKKKKIFNSIKITSNENDKKIYKIIEFHIEKLKSKLIKKIYKKNFLNFIGNKKKIIEKIKNHKNNFYFFEEEENENENESKKFIEFEPNILMQILDDDEDVEDERLQEIIKQKNNMKKIDNFNSIEMKKTTNFNKKT